LLRASAHRTKSADDILVAIAETPDITLVELQKKLQARGVSAGIGTLWRFFDRRRITFKNVWPAPSASDFVEDAFVQSASTYPASGSCPRPRWRSARPGPHKTLGVERHFLNQGSSTPFDCQAISLPPLANIVSPSTHQSRCQADSYANMGASLAAKCCPCRRTAHEMRASLLASATTATFG
jgi:hypothetical protein